MLRIINRSIQFKFQENSDGKSRITEHVDEIERNIAMSCFHFRSQFYNSVDKFTENCI